MDVFLCVCVWVCVCNIVCVCVRERETVGCGRRGVQKTDTLNFGLVCTLQHSLLNIVLYLYGIP
jgi:hypothetical protein